MRSVFLVWCVWVGLVMGGLVGCQTRRVEETPGREIVRGRVASVPESMDFVLIETAGGWVPAAGESLKTRGEGGREGQLAATTDYRRPFAVADIVSGEVEVGDVVIGERRQSAAGGVEGAKKRSRKKQRPTRAVPRVGL